MSVRTILYVIILPLVIWALDSININGIFKKNRYYQVRLLYLIISMSITYLIVNFLMDFFESSRFI